MHISAAVNVYEAFSLLIGILLPLDLWCRGTWLLWCSWSWHRTRNCVSSKASWCLCNMDGKVGHVTDPKGYYNYTSGMLKDLFRMILSGYGRLNGLYWTLCPGRDQLVWPWFHVLHFRISVWIIPSLQRRRGSIRSSIMESMPSRKTNHNMLLFID
jgi:hypothetical protein